MKKLALFLDGTWNDPQDETNVHRLHELLSEKDKEGVAQKKEYIIGVGTAWYERVRGGWLGMGLEKNLQEAYQWLVDQYNDGDQIYLFGFSRGAYTARSVSGLIKQCGLLRPDSPLTPQQIFARYKDPSKKPIYRLKYLKDHPKANLDGYQFTVEDLSLLEYSRRPEIEFVGVWDTVGALGIPAGKIPSISRSSLQFHNTYPSNIYKHCYQALAIDEHRKPYAPTLWKNFTELDNSDDAITTSPSIIEQRWFAGAHSNIGGGYKNDKLAEIPLQWMQEKAIGHGLHFDSLVRPTEDAWKTKPQDSFKAFLLGAYSLSRFGRRFYRTIGAPPFETMSRDGKRGLIAGINEVVDPSAIQKLRDDEGYDPPNLKEWLERTTPGP